MNTVHLETELAEKYCYKKLSDELSAMYREIFIKNMPEFLKVDGDKTRLYSNCGTLICKGYTRIVVGDYGAFIEFNEQQASLPFKVKRGQEYRIFCPSFGKYE